jgi:hypothetical protein
MLRRILIGALLIAAIIVIVRTVIGTPAMRHMVEGFQAKAAPSTLNTVTECPAGTQLFMYNGAAYCCNGIMNPDADDIGLTCKAPLVQNFDLTFCTLGPPASRVPNCMELRAGQMQAKGEALCPVSLPNYAQGALGSTTATGRCCQTMANAAFTDCVDITGPNSFCDQTTVTNIFTVPGSCQFLRLAGDASAQCPTGYSQFTMAGQGDYIGMTLIGCSNSSQSCYPQAVLDAIVATGHSTEGLTPCSVQVPASVPASD